MASTSAAQDVAPEGEDDKDAQESSLYKEDSFRMYCMKVLPCSKRYCHDWTTCPFSHPGEKARRRDPRTQPHTGIACPDRKKEGTCVRGDNCPYAHNVFEYWLHPTRYRTQLCNDGTKCRRHICFFAHSLEELRVPTCKPFVPPDALAAATSAAAADFARKAGGGSLDAATLRSLADAVLSGTPQPNTQAVDLAQNLLQSNPSSDALVRQLAQMQMQNQQVNYQQQQQDQLNAMSVLTAYLREAQAQQQAQAQAQQQNQQAPPPPADKLTPEHPWPSAMSERQQLAFRSLSEAAVDQRFNGRQSSDVVRAALQAPASSSFPGDIIQSQGLQNSHLSAASTAGMSLAQQSLLYAPSQQTSTHAQMLPPPQFSPQAYPFGSSRSSLEQGFRSSDPGRRPSFSNHDWMSTNSGPSRYSTGSGPASSRYSMESDFFSTGRRNSLGMRSGLHNSFDLDWAGRSVGRTEPPSGFMPGQEAFNPFQYSTPFRPGGAQESHFPQNIQDPFTRRPVRASQDSNASTLMHTDGGRRSAEDRPSMESISGGHHFQQQQPQHTFGSMQSSGGPNQGVFQPSGPPPLGSGRGLETMLEDEDPRVSHVTCSALCVSDMGLAGC
ncbi:TPA: hypothetical protein ACH3X2_000507 [Trebouxia sp. C0005]